MSHVVAVQVEIRDLEAVRRMCRDLGWSFVEGQKTYEWYGHQVGTYEGQDNALLHGVTEQELGTCDHAIRVPNCIYEIGLKQVGDQYRLLWDPFDSQLRKAMGGEKATTFMQEYGKAAVITEAERNGYQWTASKLETGDYEIEIETY